MPLAGLVYFFFLSIFSFSGDSSEVTRILDHALVEPGLNVNMKLPCGDNPLQLAVRNNNEKMVKLLMQYDVQVSYDFNDWIVDSPSVCDLALFTLFMLLVFNVSIPTTLFKPCVFE